MAIDELSEYVKRYTTLSRAIKALKNKRLALPNPSKWDDLNDQEFVKLYQEHIGAESVYAMCCTMSPERYHHWRIFTEKESADGVCMEFRRMPLEQALKSMEGVRAERVYYVSIKQMREPGRRLPEDLPFIKRSGYRDEREWRILLTSSERQRALVEIPFEIEWVHRIILNPWMAKTARVVARRTLTPLIQKPTRVTATFLTESNEWKRLGRGLVS